MFGGTYYVLSTGLQGEQVGVVSPLSQLTARGGGHDHRQDRAGAGKGWGAQEGEAREAHPAAFT